MTVGYPNLFIYVSIGCAVLYSLFSFLKASKTPTLAEFFSVILSSAAAYSAIELGYLVLEGTKKLGDFEDSKLMIILGSISVMWVSISTIVSHMRDKTLSKS